MSLPIAWVDKIFMKLTLVYGAEFLRRWEGVSVSDVKTDWSHELAGFDENPEAIAHALQNLPSDKPPNVFQFRAIARTLPSKQPVLPKPESASAKVIAAQLIAMAPIKNIVKVDGREWARRIVRSAEAGDKVPLYSLNLAKSALNPHALVAA